MLKVSGDLVEVMTLPDVQQKMQEMGSQLVPNSPAEFRKFVGRDRESGRGGEGVRGESVD